VRLLVLGGTRFVGRHVVEAALARGHDVALFNRGRTNAGLFDGVEYLRGDRATGDVAALDGGRFDATIDVSGYTPRDVEVILGADAELGHYVFVSTISVHYDIEYGRQKLLAEGAVPGGASIVRPGIVAGKHDHTERLTYWAQGLARGERLVAGDPKQPVQVIDARDLAAFLVDLAETRRAGTFTAVGPEQPLTFADLLADADVEWHASAAKDLPLVLPDREDWDAMRFDSREAIAAGLRLRPIPETLAYAAG
jgi:2'-hydroxyisoflavone reductase